MQTSSAELAASSSPSTHGETWLTTAQVRARQGGISDMSLWRWTNDPDMRFPEPDDRRNGRKYWKLSTIVQWEAERAAKVGKLVQKLERQIERGLAEELRSAGLEPA